MPDSFRPHGLQHDTPPCPSPSPGVCSNSCPLSRWCRPTILSSAIPFFCLQSFPESGSFPMSQLFTWGGQSIGASTSVPVLPMSIQDWFPLGLTGLISLLSKGLSGVFSSTTVWKQCILLVFALFRPGKNHTLWNTAIFAFTHVFWILLDVSSRRDSRTACPIAKTKITQRRAVQLSVKKPYVGISREHCCDDLGVCLLSQSCPTLSKPMVCSPPGSSIHGILQARILEWVAISFSRGSSPSRDRTPSLLCLLHCRQILYLLNHQKRGWVMLLKSQPDLLLFQLLWIQKRFCPLLIPCMNSSWASWWLSDKESACQCRRCRFDPWIRKIPWIRKWQPTPVFLSGKSHGQNMSLVGYRPWVWIELDMTEWLSTHRSSQSVGSQRARYDLATEHRMKGTFHLIKRKSYNFKTMQVKRGMWSV